MLLRVMHDIYRTYACLWFSVIRQGMNGWACRPCVTEWWLGLSIFGWFDIGLAMVLIESMVMAGIVGLHVEGNRL